MFFIERQHSIIEHVGGSDRCFRRVELGMSNFTVGIDKRLLIDPTNTLESTYCSGQVKLATDLEEFQKSSSVLFGVNPSLC